MVSIEERREIAANLRKYAECDECENCEECEDACTIDRDDFGNTVLTVLHVCGESYRTCYDRLADLIEPSDHIGDSDKMVDREALLALAGGLETDADRIIKAAKNAQFGVGPRMGKAKLDAAEWRSIARRIREACGEVVA